MPTNLTLVRRSLLRWYVRNRRSLPWRRTRDPYAVWIAETMLQQTQVKTVLPYYRRFLKSFPRLGTLARAPGEKVLALWSGLGYYRRAQNLHRAARLIVREHGGALPKDYDALRALPGIGPYTAGAVMSIAFNRPYPALDGNARRVLGRAFAVRREKDLQALALELVAGPRPGRFNQALMELGARVCRAREPRCPECPLARLCAARRTGSPTRHGGRAGKPKVKTIDWPMAVIGKDGKILLRRRPAGGLLGGLWELPGGERRRGESRAGALRRHLDGLGPADAKLVELGVIRHSITNRRIRAPVYRAVIGNVNRLPRADWRWVSFRFLRRYPVSSLTLKAIGLLSRR